MLCRHWPPLPSRAFGSLLRPSSSPVHKVGEDVNDGPEASRDGMGYPPLWQRACEQAPVNTALLHAHSNMTDPCTPAKTVQNDRSAPIIPFPPAQLCERVPPFPLATVQHELPIPSAGHSSTSPGFNVEAVWLGCILNSSQQIFPPLLIFQSSFPLVTLASPPATSARGRDPLASQSTFCGHLWLRVKGV